MEWAAGLGWNMQATAKIDNLSALPDKLRRELANAAVTLDQEATLSVLDGLRSQYPREAELIANLIKDFRFGRIFELTEDQL